MQPHIESDLRLCVCVRVPVCETGSGAEIVVCVCVAATFVAVFYLLWIRADWAPLIDSESAYKA